MSAIDFNSSVLALLRYTKFSSVKYPSEKFLVQQLYPEVWYTMHRHLGETKIQLKLTKTLSQSTRVEISYKVWQAFQRVAIVTKCDKIAWNWFLPSNLFWNTKGRQKSKKYFVTDMLNAEKNLAFLLIFVYLFWY